MSLLLDALKKAELAKQRQQQGGAAPETESAPVEPAAGEYPSLSLQLEQPAETVEPEPVPVAEPDPGPALAEKPVAAADLALEPVVDSVDASLALIEADSAPATEMAAPEPPAVPEPVIKPPEPTSTPPVSAPPPASNSPLASRFGARGPQTPAEPRPETPSEPAAAPVRPEPASAGPEPAASEAKPGPQAAKPSPEAARRVMAAKPQRKPLNRTAVLIAGSLLLIGGMAAYLWWQMQPPSFDSPPATDMPAESASAETPTGDAGATAADPAVAPGPTIAAPQGGAADRAPDPAAVPRPAAGKPAPQPAQVGATGSSARQPALQVSRDVGAPALDEGVDAGYRAFQQGDLAAARLAYGRSLQADPRNRDAILGMAAVTARQGRMDEAERWYRKQLELDPLDPAAQAGLAAVARGLGPREREAELRSQGESAGGNAQALAQLGNLYAAERRWNEAQQQYFRAFSQDPGNPDLAFNLAVSLEHLDQPRLALDYYRRAQQLSTQRRPGFDPAELKARIEALSQP